MLQLRSLSIKCFRGIREGTIEGLTDVNILIGRNNCGKSTVLEAVTNWGAVVGGGGADMLGHHRHSVWNGMRLEQQLFSPQMWFNQDQTQTIELEGRVGEPQTEPRLLAVCSARVGPDRPQEWLRTVKFEEGGIGETAMVNFARNFTIFFPEDARNQNIERAHWQQLLFDRSDKRLVQRLNELFELDAEQFQVLPHGTLVVLYPTRSLPLDVQGDGTRAAVRLLMVLTLLKKTLLMLEEPETHQHPGSLKRLAQVVCQQAREGAVQLLIATHSAECMSAFVAGAQQAGSQAAVFHLSLQEGRLDARLLDPEAVSTLQETGLDVRFLDLYV